MSGLLRSLHIPQSNLLKLPEHNKNYDLQHKSNLSYFLRIPLLRTIMLSNMNYNRMFDANMLEYRRKLIMYPRFDK